jgi:hypothetical protein
MLEQLTVPSEAMLIDETKWCFPGLLCFTLQFQPWSVNQSQHKKQWKRCLLYSVTHQLLSIQPNYSEATTSPIPGLLASSPQGIPHVFFLPISWPRHGPWIQSAYNQRLSLHVNAGVSVQTNRLIYRILSC